MYLCWMRVNSVLQLHNQQGMGPLVVMVNEPPRVLVRDVASADVMVNACAVLVKYTVKHRASKTAAWVPL